MIKADKTINFLGYKIISNPMDQLLINLFLQITSGTNLKTVFTPNPEQLVYAKSHSSFDKVLGKSDYLIPDGIGIVLGARFLSIFGKSEQIHERITGVDVVASLLQKFPDKKVLVIGGRGYEKLKYQDWKIVKAGSVKPLAEIKSSKKNQKNIYWHEGFLNVTLPTDDENKTITQIIKTLKPDIVFVALGAPHQEEWVINNKQLLAGNGVRLSMVVGGAFDMLLGKVKRAPKWMQRVGLEWLFRLKQEPWRWRRQVGLIVFVKMVVQEFLN
jgi:N-acetylglucosaminyldiphosphoundecaprenol N-acetyl-beta-D-mannosaminyltransferase